MKTTIPKPSSVRRLGWPALGALFVMMGIAAPAAARDYNDRHEYREAARHEARHHAPPPRYGHGYKQKKHHQSHYRPAYYRAPHHPVYYSAPHHVAAPSVYYRNNNHHQNRVDIHFQQRY